MGLDGLDILDECFAI